MAEERDSIPKKKTNFVGNIIRFFFYLLVWTVFALLINIFIEVLGMLFNWWELPGAEHSNQMLSVELGWLNRDFQGVLGSPTDNAIRFSTYMYDLFFVWFGYDIAQSSFEFECQYRLCRVHQSILEYHSTVLCPGDCLAVLFTCLFHIRNYGVCGWFDET